MKTEPIKYAARFCFVGESDDDQPADIVLSLGEDSRMVVGSVRLESNQKKANIFGAIGSNFGGVHSVILVRHDGPCSPSCLSPLLVLLVPLPEPRPNIERAEAQRRAARRSPMQA
jgi:hypothetical protein